MKKIIENIKFLVITRLAYWILRLISASLSREEKNMEVLEKLKGTPTIFAFWHNRLFFLPYQYRYNLKRKDLTMLISKSRDGRYIGKVVELFGLKVCYGSSKKGGDIALREMAKIMEQGYNAGITPDGPRGPRYEVKPGIIALAQISGAPIVPVSYNVNRKKVFKSWDKFIFPLPFAKVNLALGEPIYVEKHITPENKEKIQKEIRDSLLKLNAETA